MALLSFTDVSLAFGLNPLLDKVSFQLDRGERVCLIGRNGAGKSSLFRLIDGDQPADEGEIWAAPGLKIGQLPQELPKADDKTVYDVVAAGLAGVGDLLAEYHHLITGDMGDAELARLEKVQERLEAKDGWRLDQLVETTLTRLGLPADKVMSELSGGWRRRVLLAQALVALPLVVRTLVPVLSGVGDRLRQAAASLGAGPVRTLVTVDLPVVWKPLLAAGGFAFAVSLGEFGATSFLARPDDPTLPVVIFRLIGRPGPLNDEMAMAASVVLAGTTALVMLLVERLRVPSVGAL